jgi:hypothetical protein
MTPILGILASGISGNLWAPGKDFDSIATATGTGASGTITFSSIPQTYRHLQLRITGRGSTGATGIYFQFNGDTAANYAQHYLYADGASVSAGAFTSTATPILSYLAPSTASASVYSANVVDILDYTNANKNKTTRALNGYDNNGSGFVQFTSGLWQSTAAITSITLVNSPSGNYATSTQFALYGIK